MSTPTRFNIKAIADLLVSEQSDLDRLTRDLLTAKDALAVAAHRAEPRDDIAALVKDRQVEVRLSERRVRHYRLVWSLLTGLTGEDADSAAADIAARPAYTAHYSDMTD